LVRELVASLEEARAGFAPTFEAAPPLPALAPEELGRLRSKLDLLALEVARRDGELAARAWRITELENEKTRLAAAARGAPGVRGREGELGPLQDQLDALRQALTQEHAARVAAESGLLEHQQRARGNEAEG